MILVWAHQITLCYTTLLSKRMPSSYKDYGAASEQRGPCKCCLRLPLTLVPQVPSVDWIVLGNVDSPNKESVLDGTGNLKRDRCHSLHLERPEIGCPHLSTAFAGLLSGGLNGETNQSCSSNGTTLLLQDACYIEILSNPPKAN